MKELIPIFPLNLVMYPGSIYPLHIFEERYKSMINRCMSEKIGFGIVSKIENEISTVGCYVELLEIYNTYENGSMDILVKGINKFKTTSTALHQDGYIEAMVTSYIDSEHFSFDDLLLNKTLNKFKEILEKTNIELDKKFWKRFDESKLKSYKIAEKSGLNLRQQQNLLSLRTEKDRLTYLFEHFARIEEYLERSEVLKDIIAGDGYIN